MPGVSVVLFFRVNRPRARADGSVQLSHSHSFPTEVWIWCHTRRVSFLRLPRCPWGCPGPTDPHSEGRWNPNRISISRRDQLRLRSAQARIIFSWQKKCHIIIYIIIIIYYSHILSSHKWHTAIMSKCFEQISHHAQMWVLTLLILTTFPIAKIPGPECCLWFLIVFCRMFFFVDVLLSFNVFYFDGLDLYLS